MSTPIIQPSLFLGKADAAEPDIDRMENIGVEVIDGEACCGIEVSMYDQQRAGTFGYQSETICHAA